MLDDQVLSSSISLEIDIEKVTGVHYSAQFTTDLLASEVARRLRPILVGRWRAQVVICISINIIILNEPVLTTVDQIRN